MKWATFLGTLMKKVLEVLNNFNLCTFFIGGLFLSQIAKQISIFSSEVEGEELAVEGAVLELGLPQLWASMSDLLGTKLHHTTTYHPQANGLVKRFHRHLKSTLHARLKGPN